MTEETKTPTVKCPKCSSEFHVALNSAVPDEQRMTIRLNSESPFIPAEVVGQAIAGQVKVLRSVAKTHGVMVSIFVTQMVCVPGSVEIEFTIIAKERKPEPTRLIAEMLKALQVIANHFDGRDDYPNDEEVIATARAVIAKATDL
jgi:hypothetical protein